MTHKGIIVLLFMTAASGIFAQEKPDTVIDIRQRMFRFKRDTGKGDVEKVDSFRTLHLMIAGNIYQTEKHVHYAYKEAENHYDFKDEFKYVQPLLNLGDVTIANLKTSFGNDATDMFSSPDEFAIALKYSGVNALMSANVHTANITRAKLKRTRDLLYSFDMYHTGSFTDIMQRNGNYPLIINKKGFRIAVLNYTDLPARPAGTMGFIINQADKSILERDMRMARVNRADFIIVYFDWGLSINETPSHQQIELAQFAFQQGANLVVGTQPNSPMRIDYMNYSSNGTLREGIVAYSLGNLVASTEESKNRNGYIIDMELKKNNYTNETSTSDWGIIPVYTYYDTVSVRGETKVYSVPSSGVESGDIFANIPYIEKRRAVNSAYEIRKLLGSVADEIQYNLNELIVSNVQETINITNASLNNKFSAKQEEEIEPSDAPALAVAVPGSNNPPSLAILYKEPLKPEVKKELTAMKNEKRIDQEKSKAQLVFEAPKPLEERTEEITSRSSDGVSAIPSKGNSTIAPVSGKNLKPVIDTFYRIQFYALKKYIPLDTNYYPHLKGYEVKEEEGLFKYYLGRYGKYEDCVNYWKSQILPRYRQSFIIKYVNGKQVLQ